MNIDLDASILSDDLVIDWSGYKDWFDTNQAVPGIFLRERRRSR